MAVWRNFTVLGVILLLIFGFYKAVRGYKIEFVCEPFQVNKPHGIVFSDEEKKLIALISKFRRYYKKVLLDAPHLTQDNSFQLA